MTERRPRRRDVSRDVRSQEAARHGERRPPRPGRGDAAAGRVGSAGGARSRRRRRRGLRWLTLLVFIVCVALAGFGVVKAVGAVRDYFARGSLGPEVRVTVKSGQTLSAIATTLESAGVVRHAFPFEEYAKKVGHTTDLKPGSYVLHKNEKYDVIIAKLVGGVRPVTLKVTIPEGYTVRQTAIRLGQKIAGFDAGAYLKIALEHPPAFMLVGYRSDTMLEGLLFPATYDVLPAITPGEFIAKQLAAFTATLAGIDMSRARKANLTPYDVAIIASMVEREAKVANERRLVAAVIWNRLRLRMPLQIDATVEYALPTYKTTLTLQDLKIQSPYNTYLHVGLPPTPIANPGAAALIAAAAPAKVNFLYYVARNDGSGRHYFASTYAQFLRDKAKAGL
jgi:UPF0755 protein